MNKACTFIAVLAAIGLAAVGFVRGTYAAGGSDSSCYALMAEAFASGALQPTSALVAQVPWPDAPGTFTPGGFVPSDTDPAASAPVCAPGFSVLLAPVVMAGGLDAMFAVTPLAGALLVWMTFLSGRTLAGPRAGAMAAVLMATTPAALYQVVQPMNDIATAALWTAVFAALVNRRWALAGVCCGLALLVRPNLLPLAAVAATFVIVAEPIPRPIPRPIPNPQSLIPRLFRFCAGVLPFGLLVLWLNSELYGSPFRTGYGQLDHLFAFSNISTNAARYPRWLIETHTPFPFLALLALFVVPRDRRREVLLALGLIGATVGLYLVYTPFDDWSYLRFLLPAIALMLVLASAVVVTLLQYAGYVGSGFSRMDVGSGFSRTFIIVCLTSAIALFSIRAAVERQAFALQFLEQRYRSAGMVVRDQLPPGAVVLSVWDSGAVRFHGRKEALTWAGLDPAWLDRCLVWLERQDYQPYVLVESWEEAGFRARFGEHSDIGKLDWPPKYEVDRMVRIYDPQDRARHHRGEPVNTEYVWPLRR